MLVFPISGLSLMSLPGLWDNTPQHRRPCLCLPGGNPLPAAASHLDLGREWGWEAALV